MTDVAQLVAQDHTFALADGPDFSIESADWSTGLGVQMSAGCMIYTGINRGVVHVQAIAMESEPDIWQPQHWADVEQWDDAIDISVNAPVGNLRVHQISYGPSGTPPNLPNLSPHGPGAYRLRVFARGRDHAFEKSVEVSNEEYLIMTWPSRLLSPLIIRATSRSGYGMRVGELRPIETTALVQPPPSPLQSKDQALRARNLLGHAE